MRYGTHALAAAFRLFSIWPNSEIGDREPPNKNEEKIPGQAIMFFSPRQMKNLCNRLLYFGSLYFQNSIDIKFIICICCLCGKNQQRLRRNDEFGIFSDTTTTRLSFGKAVIRFTKHISSEIFAFVGRQL